jgi:AcrR family transcriptional regulator
MAAARLDPEERRAQLVALGVASLVDHPLEALTIERLSAQAGVSRALLFHYFGSKQGLHHAVVLTARDAMLHASEPRATLEPLARLRDTLSRLVAFVRDHRGTFYSLVRGAASADAVVRELVDEARVIHAERAIAVFVELGHPDTALLRIALRSWVAFAEEMLVDGALSTDLPGDELVELLVRSAQAVVASLEAGVASA